MSETAKTTRSTPWLRWAVDGAPAVGFLATLLGTPLVSPHVDAFRAATYALIGLSVLALIAGLVLERRVAPIPLFSGGAAVLFGVLSLVLHRNDILQMKMSIIDTLLGGALLTSLLLKRNPLKALLGGAFSLTDRAWKILAVRYAFFFFACAIANEIVRRTQTPQVWAVFRLVAIGAAVAFAVLQTPFLMKHSTADDVAAPPAPPEAGF